MELQPYAIQKTRNIGKVLFEIRGKCKTMETL